MSHIENIAITKLNPNAIIPTYGTEGAAGADLYALNSGKVVAGGSLLVKTGIAMAIPNGYYGQIAPRSSLAYKNSIGIGGGIIDSDYRGDVGVILFNHSSNDFVFKAGDRIAQIIIKPCVQAKWQRVDDLSSTVRNTGGFGSTGE